MKQALDPLPGFKQFRQLLHTSFMARTAAGEIPLQLDSAEEINRPGWPDELHRPLSLLFTSESPIILNQDVYTLNHPDLGSLRLLLVPVNSKNPDKPLYQAIIN